jgi:vacuolar-type H+-ATPase subunit I/STV1
MTIMQRNRRRRSSPHKFLLSSLLFGCCMTHLTACALRIAWAERPRHTPLAIVAQVFVSAGVMLLFITNPVFAQRIVRAALPRRRLAPALWRAPSRRCTRLSAPRSPS